MSFPGVSVQQANIGKNVASEGSGFLSGASALVNPVVAGLSVAGGLSGMLGGGGKSGMDVSKAVSGGTFTTGNIESGKSGTTVVIIVAVLLGLYFILKRKK